MPPDTISVARPTKWGNPFHVGRKYAVSEIEGLAPHVHGRDYCDTPLTAKDAVALYAHYLLSHVALRVEAERELKGKNLACWCGPEIPCHAEVLLEYVNMERTD